MSEWRERERVAQAALRAGEMLIDWQRAYWTGSGFVRIKGGRRVPLTRQESAKLREPLEVLAEISRAMLGEGETNGPETLAAARRFARSAESDRKASASTADEIAADALYEAAKPYLNRKPHRNRIAFSNEPSSRTAWTTLAAFLSRVPGAPVVDANRLRMICKARRK